MSFLLRRDPDWAECFFARSVDTSTELVGGDDIGVNVPSTILLAASPLLRDMLTNLPHHPLLSPQ